MKEWRSQMHVIHVRCGRFFIMIGNCVLLYKKRSARMRQGTFFFMIENCVLSNRKSSARVQSASGACYAPTAVERRSALPYT